MGKGSPKLFGLLGSAVFLSVLLAASVFFASRAFMKHADVAIVPMPSPNERSPAATAIMPSAPVPFPICGRFYETVCQKRGTTRDPTGVVRPDIDGEIMALRIYEEIIHKHPDWASDQVDEELVQTIYTKKRLDRVREAYDWVKKAIGRFIERQPATAISAADKHRLLDRVSSVRLDLPPPASAYSDEPDLFTKNDVYYERVADGKIRMRVGGAYLFSAKSRFNLIFTMGHEFAHSIDPCELSAAQIQIPSYRALTTCFVAKKYVNAIPAAGECAEGSQLSETFADWVAVQITAEALQTETTGYNSAQIQSSAVNAVRDLCEQDESLHEVDTVSHPEPRVRIERLFGNQSAIRAIFGCPAPAHPDLYCSFESATPTGASP